MNGHYPVMYKEVLDLINLPTQGILVDGTFGGGGHSGVILQKWPRSNIYAIDQDPDAQTRAQRFMEETSINNFTFLSGNFADMTALLASHNITKADAILLDLGVSSFQLDQAERGFAIAKDGPLDMRMSQSGPSAYDVVNDWKQQELSDIIFKYGEERFASRITRKIIEKREIEKIKTTFELASIVRSAIPRSRNNHQTKIDPATRTFQGIRIAINEELTQLSKGLEACKGLLGQNGRLIVISFHSLEDRIVKQAFKQWTQKTDKLSRHHPEALNLARQSQEKNCQFKIITNKPLVPTSEEMHENPRSRSARMRIIERNSLPDDLADHPPD